MSENSLPPRPKPLACGAAQPVKRPPDVAIKYTEESSPMCLGVAMGYFGSCLTREFRVEEGVYSPKGSEGVVKGDIFIACLTKQESFLKIRSAVSSPGNVSVTVPVVTRTEFALVPREEGNVTDTAIRNWEGTFHSVTEFFEARSEHQSMPMPAALNVLDNALDHNRQKVPAKTILFNIRQVSRWVGLHKRCGIEGVDCSGVVHQFLEGKDPVYFSTKLFDVKCLPMCFKNVLQFPQTARVYLHPNAEEEEEEVNLLQNLSTVTITEVSHGHHLVVRKLSADGNHLGPAFTVPLTADLKVVAIKLKDSHLLDNISDQRYIVRAKLSPSIGPTDSQADMYINPYSDDPSEATRGDIQAGRKDDHDKEAYYNADTSRLMQHHKYDNVQGAVAFVPSHVSTGSTAAGATDQYYVMISDTELDDVSDVFEYMPGSKLISSVTPRGKKLPLYPGNPTQPLAVPLKQWKNWKDSGVRSLGNSPALPARKEDSHSPCSDCQMLRSMSGRGKDAMDSAPLETPTRNCHFVKESQSLPLDTFAGYYSHRFPQCVLIDEINFGEETKGGDCHSELSNVLSPGQLVVVYVEMNVPTIHARVEDAQQALLSIPVACTGLQVALLPPNDPEMIIVNRSWERKFTSVSEILASSTLPPAFKVMKECFSHDKSCVKAGVILFNIEMVHVGFLRQKAIQGTSAYRTKYTFLNGSRVFFSSRQYDTRCSLRECADIVRYPQKVTAFLNEEESREFPQLKNLSELTLTGKEEKKYLLMCKMKKDGSVERKLHTLPADSTTKVTAINMDSCDMVKVNAGSRNFSKEQHRPPLPLPPTPPPGEHKFELQSTLVTRSLLCLDDEELYDEPDELMQCTSSASTLLAEPVTAVMMKSCEMAKMTSSRIISKEHHRSLLPLPLTPSPSECNRFDVQCLDDEELYDEPDQLMQGLERTTSASPLLAVPPHARTSPTVDGHENNGTDPSHAQTDSEAEIATKNMKGSLLGGQGNEAPPTNTEVQGVLHMRCNTAPPHPTPSPAPVRRNTTCNGSDLQTSTLARRTGIDVSHGCSHGHLEHHLLTCVESPEYTYVKVGIPTQGRPRGPQPLRQTKLKQRVPHQSQPPSVLPHPQTLDRYDENIYEEIVEAKSTQQREVKSGQKLTQPRASQSPAPAVPTHQDHSSKPKLKGVPDTAILLTPVPSTRALQSPHVHKKPIMSMCSTVSCPKERDLRYHVAAKLGQDWRKVCSYLGLQHCQLEQADEAHSLEDKAMEALVMWLKGQGDSKAPRSWNTLLQALRLAGLNDMASDVERGINSGTLQLTQPISAQSPCTQTLSTVSFVPSPASSGYTAAFASTDTVAAHVRLSQGLKPPDEPQSSVQPAGVGSESPKEPGTVIVKAAEVALNDLCWIPFGVQLQSAGPEGRRLLLAGAMGWGEKETIHLEVPPGAVGPSENVEVHSAVIPYGPFTPPEGYQFGSMVVYIYYNGQCVTCPLRLHLPHWYGGDNQIRDGLSFAMAPHTLKEGECVYHFELLEGGKVLNNHCGELEIDGHCSLFAEVFKKGAMSRYQAIALQKEEGSETTCDVAVMYASPLWCEILMKHRKEKSGWTVSNPSCPFTFGQDRIKGLLKEDHGNGWHAVINGSHVLQPHDLEYDYRGITNPKLLEMAVNNRGYPPAITCAVTYQEELRRTGKPVWVVLELLGAENELSFMCKAYEQADRNAAAAASQSPEASPTDVVPDCYPTTPPQPEPSLHCSLNQRPTLKSLDEKVVVHVAGKWDTIGLHLDIEDYILQSIKTPNGSNNKHCLEMFRHWLARERGCGSLPRTWSSVLHAVKIGCGSEVCQEIAELL